jgi:hypothetical protein
VRIERSIQGRLVVAPEGNLDEALARRLHDALTGELDRQPSTEVLVDLRNVGDYQPAAREILLETQRVLLRRHCRSAWLAERARLRGLALWLMHAAEDPLSRAVLTPEQAELWLSGSSRRIDDARARTQEALRSVERTLAATNRTLGRQK